MSHTRSSLDKAKKINCQRWQQFIFLPISYIELQKHNNESHDTLCDTLEIRQGMIKRRLNFTRISLTDLSCSVELVFLYEGPNIYLSIACV